MGNFIERADEGRKGRKEEKGSFIGERKGRKREDGREENRIY